jgi:hypothetical protein
MVCSLSCKHCRQSSTTGRPNTLEQTGHPSPVGTHNLWQFCNGIVHSHTVEAAAELEYTKLRAAVTQKYEQFDTDPHVISAQFNALFTRRSLQEHLHMDRDSLSCWLRTVAEAKEHQRLFCSTLLEMAKRFFQTRWPDATRLVPTSIIEHPVGSSHRQGTYWFSLVAGCDAPHPPHGALALHTCRKLHHSP